MSNPHEVLGLQPTANKDQVGVVAGQWQAHYCCTWCISAAWVKLEQGWMDRAHGTHHMPISTMPGITKVLAGLHI